jgi:hypothetical protein
VRLILIAIVVTAALASSARAFEDFSGTRSLGMGGASRAWAIGDEGPLLNPSGMSLAKTYSIEAAYGYASAANPPAPGLAPNRLADSFLHASIVDSTSSYNLAGGLYYTYHTADRGGGASAQGHEGGVALSLPFGEFVSIGGTVKYFKLEGQDVVTGHDGGITFDVGATVRPTSILSFALVGANLRDLGNSQATQGIGYGVALIPTPSLVVALDGLTRFTADNQTGRKGTSVMAGGDFTIAGRFGARAGGGYDAVSGNGYLTVGFSAISEVGAFDAGLRQDLFRSEVSPGIDRPRETVVGVSLRLFVPADQTPPDQSAPLQ